MYLQTIRIKRTEDSKWESGLYIGNGENLKEGILIDSNFNAIEGKVYYYMAVSGVSLNFPFNLKEDM